MRSELNEVCLIDRYLFRQLDDEDTRAFKASLLIDGTLAEKVAAQRSAHRLIRLYAVNEERRRLQGIFRQLLDEPGFADQLKNIFA